MNSVKAITLLIYPGPCTANQLLLYDASAMDELPLNVRNEFHPDTKSSSVEVNVNSDRTVASIALPWLDPVIVIYRYANNLGIAIEMPTEMAELDKGLCRSSCPEDSLLDAAEHIHGYSLSDQESAMLSCKGFTNLDYRTACQFDVLNSKEYNIISVISALATTWKQLPDFNNNLDIADSLVISPKSSHSSHIRQFDHSNIQTCSLSEQSTLMEQHKVDIVVSTNSDEQSTGYYGPQTIASFIYPDPCTANQTFHVAPKSSLMEAGEHNGYCCSNQESAMLSCNSFSNDHHTACLFDVPNSQKYNASVTSASVNTCMLLPQDDEVSVDFTVPLAPTGWTNPNGTFKDHQEHNLTYKYTPNIHVYSP